MLKATPSDKDFIVDILVDSFYDNASVNYIIKQDNRKFKRIKGLMEYSFDLCYSFGEVFYSEDKKACALVMFPDMKKSNLKLLRLDLRFIFSSLDLHHLKKATSRESKVKSRQEDGLKYYLWFIAVDPVEQGKGIGSKLLQEVIEEGKNSGRTIYLETSNIGNVRWYKKMGFEVYNQLDLGYLLFFLKFE